MNKLVMVNVTDHELPYGTILSVKREKSKHYFACVAEEVATVLIPKSKVKDI